MTQEKPLKIMLVCGETSGDLIGGQLMAALRAENPGLQILGVGGPAMTAQGLQSLFSLKDTAVMGLREVVPAIPRILARVRQTVEEVIRKKPDALVLIDSPDFTHRIARLVRTREPAIGIVNYVAPQVWASRAYRAKKMARHFDLLLALLPFEPEFFSRYGLRTAFVGHPVIERAKLMRDGNGLRHELGISVDAPLLLLLPGSRSSEIRFILPAFRDAVALLAQKIPNLVTVLPTVRHIADKVQVAASGWPTKLHIILDENDKYRAFDAADIALAASGTVTAELALARTPMVAAYRVGWLTYKLAKPLFKLKNFTLVNLLLQREAIPEFEQDAATPQNLANAVLGLWCDEGKRKKQIAALEEAVSLLGEGQDQPSARAAKAILAFARERRGF